MKETGPLPRLSPKHKLFLRLLLLSHGPSALRRAVHRHRGPLASPLPRRPRLPLAMLLRSTLLPRDRQLFRRLQPVRVSANFTRKPRGDTIAASAACSIANSVSHRGPQRRDLLKNSAGNAVPRSRRSKSRLNARTKSAFFRGFLAHSFIPRSVRVYLC